MEQQLNPALKKPRSSASRKRQTIRQNDSEMTTPSGPTRQRSEASSPASSTAGSRLTPRQRFLNACACWTLDYPPVWLMRQAGRALPEYRALKQKYTFLE